MPSVALLIAFLAVAPIVAANPVTHSIGIARSAENGEVRYIEHHQYLPDGRHLVNYYTTDLKLVAWKRITYPFLPQHPEIEQQDLGRESRVSVDVTEDRIVMNRRTPEGEDTGVLDATPDLIVDAGFDAYIRENLNELVGAPKRTLRFAVAGLPRTLTMTIEHTSGSAGPVTFRISPKNWFIRLLIPSIDLSYSTDGRLIRYTGYSNLVPADSGSRRVSIDFDHYATDGPLDTPRPEWLPPAAVEVAASR